MKRGFVRGLWGIYDDRHHFKHRRKLDNDIKLLKHNMYAQPFKAYVFGEDNYKYLVDQGFDCKLVDKKPIVWDMDKEQFRHKIEIWRCGMEDFDEIVHLDWDTQLIKPLPSDFWEVLEQKASVQAILRIYHKSKAKKWREVDKRKVCCASWVYMRDKNIPDELIAQWEEMGRPWSEEEVLSKYTDGLVGGWKGIEKYWETFEPPYFTLEGGCKVFDDELLATKDVCYQHFCPKEVNRILKELGQQ